ncbi:MAG: hypothetical protein CMH57_11225 [Myxococcales bacterium]|nr:hypothetical protein [Myxococcales bacterium]
MMKHAAPLLSHSTHSPPSHHSAPRRHWASVSHRPPPSETQTPPPQSSVQIHWPVRSSHEQLDGLQVLGSFTHSCPTGQPFWRQPAGLGPSQALGSTQTLP